MPYITFDLDSRPISSEPTHRLVTQNSNQMTLAMASRHTNSVNMQ